jgi:acetoin utilization deacetylase AcuC-like enzyme
VRVALVTHPACLEHDTGEGHPEQPDRLRAILKALDAEEFAALTRETAPHATIEQLEAAHDAAHVRRILAIRPEEGDRVSLDPDTAMSAGSAEAALRAAGGAARAVDLVMEGKAEAAFAAVRPPGHHAERDRAMGFCFFNNVAIAAHHARDRWGLARIAVADFDVHHGNGTQAMFWNDPALFFASSHQSPCYPGTGSPHDHGVAGNIVNAALAPGSGSAEFRRAWEAILLPALAAFAPDLLIISAGFDAHRADPLAQLRLETEDFGWITAELAKIAKGRIVSSLEGGYDLDALAQSAAAHVRALMRA